jgi:uncharacterized caspase-like protein
MSGRRGGRRARATWLERGFVWVFAVAIFWGFTTMAQAEVRIALLIGESDYRNVKPLANPARDAQAMAAALRSAGFSKIIVNTNLTRSDISAALQAFTSEARDADVALVYYAGHGMELDGVNYLIPVDARLASDDDVQYETINLELAMRAASRARRLSLVLVDACRNNPFANTMHFRNGGHRAVDRGLTRVEPVGNSLVVYAARDGTTADDGVGDSPFASSLVRRLPTPGLEVGLLFRKVRDDVLAATNNTQEPFTYGSIGGDPFYFVPESPSAAAALPNPRPSPVLDPRALEIEFWESIKSSSDPAYFRAYLTRYPQGSFGPIAANRLAALQAPPAPATEPANLVETPSYSEAEAWGEWTQSVQFAGRSQTIIAFLARYPSGPHVGPARRRLQELQNQGK